MIFVCLDLESVLIPELWPAVGDALGIDELRLTTRDVADRVLLHDIRLAALKKHRVSTATLRRIVSSLRPLPGAIRFISWLRPRYPFAIVSDCFRPLALPLLTRLGTPATIAHQWRTRRTRAGGRTVELITALPLRIPGDTKAPVVHSLRALGYRVAAVGDSLNDLGMLRAADLGIWFRPAPRALARAPRLPVCHSYRQIQQLIGHMDRHISK